MCIFTRPVKSVSGTQIFARSHRDGRQSLVYALSLAALEDVAMVLPIPVAAGVGEDAIRFVSLKHYRSFFRDVNACFTLPKRRSTGKAAAMLHRAPATLKVHRVGDFEASFVPTVPDFLRLDARFRLPEAVLKTWPMYEDFGFVVCKLKAGQGVRRVHPLAFVFARKDPRRIFFPTTHLHGDHVPAVARFDHILYAQGASIPKGSPLWQHSSERAGRRVDKERARGLIDAGRLVARCTLRGALPNQDLTLRAA